MDEQTTWSFSWSTATLEDHSLENIHFSIIFSQGGQMHGCNYLQSRWTNAWM